MISMAVEPVKPVDREVLVTVTLPFKESDLRAKAQRSRLASFLAEEFGKRIGTETSRDESCYAAFESAGLSRD